MLLCFEGKAGRDCGWLELFGWACSSEAAKRSSGSKTTNNNISQQSPRVLEQAAAEEPRGRAVEERRNISWEYNLTVKLDSNEQWRV
ncbi:hypothetical protein SRHO_G00245840 [Serrasalmus rhombeus]